MEIGAAGAEDLAGFQELARREGWRVPRGELDLYGGVLCGCAFVLRREGERLGFVTAVDHGRCGWIGNLLVPEEYRRRGYGVRLFEHALDVLRFRGASDIWLTASASGRPLYERRGFRSVGRIVRWSHPGTGKRMEAERRPADEALLGRMDAGVWGEARRRLLDPLCRRGQVVRAGSTVALLQDGEGMRVLGPWISPSGCPRENREVLAAALEACDPSEELVVDLLAASPCVVLPPLAGFTYRGENELMLRGGPAAKLRHLVALASLGSVG